MIIDEQSTKPISTKEGQKSAKGSLQTALTWRPCLRLAETRRVFFAETFWFFKWFQCFCSMVLNSTWIVWFNGSMVSLFNIQNWTTKTLNSVFWSSLIVLKICEWFSLADLKHHETVSAGPSGLGKAKGCGEPRVRVDWTWCVESGISVKMG